MDRPVGSPALENWRSKTIPKTIAQRWFLGRPQARPTADSRFPHPSSLSRSPAFSCPGASDHQSSSSSSLTGSPALILAARSRSFFFFSLLDSAFFCCLTLVTLPAVRVMWLSDDLSYHFDYAVLIGVSAITVATRPLETNNFTVTPGRPEHVQPFVQQGQSMGTAKDLQGDRRSDAPKASTISSCWMKLTASLGAGMLPPMTSSLPPPTFHVSLHSESQNSAGTERDQPSDCARDRKGPA